MKKLLTILCVAMGLALMVGCAGKDGAAGPEGKDGTEITCTQCHSDDQLIAAKEYQWGRSAHAHGEYFVEEAGNSCATRCHNGAGYLMFVNKTAGSNADSMNATNINCRTCHEIHTTRTSADWKLTNVANPKLIVDTNSTFAFGKGNLCATCHQTRSLPTAVNNATTDSVTLITANATTGARSYSRVGPHYGAQAQIVSAKGGWERGDTVTYPNLRATPHINAALLADGCVSCHVTVANGKDHNWEPNVKTCQTCHSTLTAKTTTKVTDATLGDKTLAFNVTGGQLEVAQLLIQARDSLLAWNVAKLDPASPALGGVSGKWMNNDALPVGYKLPKVWIGLWFNYQIVAADKSYGVHNPVYTKFLLQSALKACGVTPVVP